MVRLRFFSCYFACSNITNVTTFLVACKSSYDFLKSKYTFEEELFWLKMIGFSKKLFYDWSNKNELKSIITYWKYQILIHLVSMIPEVHLSLFSPSDRQTSNFDKLPSKKLTSTHSDVITNYQLGLIRS